MWVSQVFEFEGGLKQECNQGSEGHVAGSLQDDTVVIASAHRTERIRSDAETTHSKG